MIGAIRPTVRMVVEHASSVGEARRRAATLAERLGFDETTRGRVALVVTEAASNLAKHAGQGELILQGMAGEGIAGRLDVLALDGGPGMTDVGRCLGDGYSTAGSPGTGLGAISRLSDRFAIHSAAGVGTALWARIEGGPPARRDEAILDLGVLSVAVAGEVACGDDWAVVDRAGSSLLLVVDGLGHGPQAAEAAAAAIAALLRTSTDEPRGIIAAADAELRGTRGAALAVARLDAQRERIHFAGVGNISATVIAGPETRAVNMISQNGTVGHSVPRIQEYEYPWPAGTTVVMHSDGLSRRWDHARYPAYSIRHPALFAGLIYRDQKRERDDVTVVVARGGSGA